VCGLDGDGDVAPFMAVGKHHAIAAVAEGAAANKVAIEKRGVAELVVTEGICDLTPLTEDVVRHVGLKMWWKVWLQLLVSTAKVLWCQRTADETCPLVVVVGYNGVVRKFIYTWEMELHCASVLCVWCWSLVWRYSTRTVTVNHHAFTVT
jgi:hypothetical protein